MAASFTARGSRAASTSSALSASSLSFWLVGVRVSLSWVGKVAAEGAAEAAAKAAARQTKGEARRQAKLVIALWEPRALVPALSPTLATHFS